MKKFDYGIKNKRILLIGCTGSLGKSHSELLSKLTSKLVIADLPNSGVEKLAKRLKIRFVEINVSKEDSIKSSIEKASKFYDGFDGAVYNSAITSEGLMDTKKYSFEKYPTELWNKAININLTGAFVFSKYIYKYLKKSNGSLIFVSSIYGLVGPDHTIYRNQSFNTFPAYAASKSGLIGFSKWLATLSSKNNIRVNCISPGGIQNKHKNDFVTLYSKRVPLGRMGDKKDVTGAIIYLLSDASRYVTGQNIVIDGGLTAW